MASDETVVVETINESGQVARLTVDLDGDFHRHLTEQVRRGELASVEVVHGEAPPETPTPKRGPGRRPKAAK